MRRIDPASLSVFLAIARHGGFRRAATELGVTPSALSHALRALEERIDLRLFNRTTRSLSLTEAGQRLLDRVQPAFRDIEDAIDDLAVSRGRPMGTLRLNAALTAAHIVVMPIVARFLRAYPDISVELTAQNALVDVVSSGFDAGIRFGETIAQDMIAVPIGPRQRFAAVASPAYFERHDKPISPRDLSGLPCIRYRFDSGVFYDWEFERGGVELAIAVEGPFTTNAQELMVEAAIDGIGIAFVFEALAEPHLASGRLVRVLETWCPFYPGLAVYFPSRRHLPAPLRAFVDFARTEAG